MVELPSCTAPEQARTSQAQLLHELLHGASKAATSTLSLQRLVAQAVGISGHGVTLAVAAARGQVRYASLHQ